MASAAAAQTLGFARGDRTATVAGAVGWLLWLLWLGGLCLLVAEGLAQVGTARLGRAVLPLVAGEVLVLMILTFVPQTVIFLPRLFGY